MRIFTVTLVVLASLAVLCFASIVELMPYDAKMYLTAAWSFLDSDRPFAIVQPNFRQPLFPLLLAPCLLQADENPFGFLATRLPHLLAAAATIAYFGLACLIYRRSDNDRRRFVAVLFLLLNPVLIHYAAMPMHDLAAGVLVLAGLVCWNAWKPGRHLAIAFALVSLGAALVAMRLNLGIVIPALLLATAICEYRQNSKELASRLWRPTLLAASAIAGGLVLMILLYAWADASWAAGPQRLIRLVQALTSIPPYETDPVWEYAWSLAIAMGPAVALLPIGIVCGLRRRQKAPFALALTTLVVLITQTFVIGHKEIRYLLPIAAGIAWCTASGFDALTTKLPPRVAAIILGILLVVPGYQSLRAVQRLASPVYHQPFVEHLAEAMRAAKADGRTVYWNGNTHPIAPHDYLFSRYDEYFAVWHFGIPDWYLATGGSARHVGDLHPSIFREPQRARFLAEERALVVQGQLAPFYTTSLLSQGDLPPIRLLWYDPSSDLDAGYVIREEVLRLPSW